MLSPWYVSPCDYRDVSFVMKPCNNDCADMGSHKFIKTGGYQIFPLKDILDQTQLY